VLSTGKPETAGDRWLAVGDGNGAVMVVKSNMRVHHHRPYKAETAANFA
jgi:hypothetical protein